MPIQPRSLCMEDTTTEVIHHEQQATEFEKYVVSMSLSLDLDR